MGIVYHTPAGFSSRNVKNVRESNRERRRADDVGRVVIHKEIRRAMRIR